MKKPFVIILSLALGVGASYAQYEDDIYYNPKKAEKKTSSDTVAKSVGLYYNPNLGEDAVLSEYDVDAYNGFGGYYETAIDTIGYYISNSDDFVYTQQIQKYYNPTIVTDNAEILADVLDNSYGNVNIIYNGGYPAFSAWNYYTPWYDYTYWPWWSVSYGWGAWNFYSSWFWGSSWSWYWGVPWHGLCYAWGWTSPGHHAPNHGIVGRGSSPHHNAGLGRNLGLNNRKGAMSSRSAGNRRGTAANTRRGNAMTSRTGRNNSVAPANTSEHHNTGVAKGNNSSVSRQSKNSNSERNNSVTTREKSSNSATGRSAGSHRNSGSSYHNSGSYRGNSGGSSGGGSRGGAGGGGGRGGGRR